MSRSHVDLLSQSTLRVIDKRAGGEQNKNNKNNKAIAEVLIHDSLLFDVHLPSRNMLPQPVYTSYVIETSTWRYASGLRVSV